MPANAWKIVCVGLPPDLCELVGKSARAAWSASTIRAIASVHDALADPEVPGRELLILAPGIADADRERVRQIVTSDGLPRWPVVVLDRGTDADSLWFLDSEAMGGDDGAARLRSIAARHDALRAAARARGDLCTIARRVGHELRSPLGCIITSAEVLREELSQGAGAIEELVQPILDSAAEMTRLINQLILIARATAVPHGTGVVDVGLAAWKARERLAMQINETGAELTEPPTWPEATGVNEWVEQIWESLLENALRHAGVKPRIELGWDSIGPEWRFFVRDHGPGVPPDECARLFRPFHQLHRIDSGRGMGLALVHRLVDLQGGRCGHERVEPHGACFHFTLPLVEPPPASPPG